MFNEDMKEASGDYLQVFPGHWIAEQYFQCGNCDDSYASHTVFRFGLLLLFITLQHNDHRNVESCNYQINPAFHIRNTKPLHYPI